MISASARLAMKQLVTFCILLEVATIHITSRFPTTASTEIIPQNMDNSTTRNTGTSYRVSAKSTAFIGARTYEEFTPQCLGVDGIESESLFFGYGFFAVRYAEWLQLDGPLVDRLCFLRNGMLHVIQRCLCASSIENRVRRFHGKK